MLPRRYSREDEAAVGRPGNPSKPIPEWEARVFRVETD
jgi:hypothetical protein